MLDDLKAIALKHGYEPSGEVPVNYLDGVRRIHYTFKHSRVNGVEALLLGIWERNGGWYFDAHKGGSRGGNVRLSRDMDKFLKAHVARAERKCRTAGNCPHCGRKATQGKFCSPYCAEIG